MKSKLLIHVSYAPYCYELCSISPPHVAVAAILGAAGSEFSAPYRHKAPAGHNLLLTTKSNPAAGGGAGIYRCEPHRASPALGEGARLILSGGSAWGLFLSSHPSSGLPSPPWSIPQHECQGQAACPHCDPLTPVAHRVMFPAPARLCLNPGTAPSG